MGSGTFLSETNHVTVEDRTGAASVVVRRVRERVYAMLKILGQENQCLSVLILNDRQIHVLNRDFLNHDEPTDVIAFSQVEGQGPSTEINGKTLLGDIVISVQTARRTAKELNHNSEYEIYFYICHGLLHLLGYDDDTPEKRAAMHRKQNQVLAELDIFSYHT